MSSKKITLTFYHNGLKNFGCVGKLKALKFIKQSTLRQNIFKMLISFQDKKDFTLKNYVTPSP